MHSALTRQRASDLSRPLTLDQCLRSIAIGRRQIPAAADLPKSTILDPKPIEDEETVIIPMPQPRRPASRVPA